MPHPGCLGVNSNFEHHIGAVEERARHRRMLEDISSRPRQPPSFSWSALTAETTIDLQPRGGAESDASHLVS